MEDSGNPYFQLDVDQTRKLVRIVRTPRVLPVDVADIKRLYAELAPRLAPYAGYAALLDLRQVHVGRNDEAFEDVVTRAQDGLARSFTRVAVLVRSAAGKLQVRRVTSGHRDVFQDEAEAIRFLVGA